MLITSHQAFLTREALQNIASVTLENIRQFFIGGELTNEVCYQCGEYDKTRKGECRKKAEGKCF